MLGKAKNDQGTYLSQLAKLNWLKFGDENSRYFHQRIRQRQIVNQILLLYDNGVLVTNFRKIQESFVTFYQQLMCNNLKCRRRINMNVIREEPLLENSHHEQLSLSFSVEEIKNALWSIPDTKSLGLDGYNSKFYKASWSIIGDDVVEAVQRFFRNGKLLQAWNTTVVHLISKVPNPNNPGIPTSLQQYIVDSCNIPLGSMPFRYLGVPLSSKRISAVECERLVVRMTSKIGSLQVRNLSYAARLQLISTVLMNITNFWCQIFVLPKKVLKQVNAIRRAYLWHGKVDSDTHGNMNWARVCTLKKLGGLGIRNLEVWNLTAVRKHVWHISSMTDSMWVRWVYGVYTKGGNWRVFNAPTTSSWAFKKTCKVKDRLDQWVHNSSYSIKEVYHELLGVGQPVDWAGFVWNRNSIHKARFIL
ncbi:uncharacterized protein LOC130828425 [Amaranthus tricolor]|uniref:uncharacterized protein LOC130828425 n=1 Tax=Amaranthus tricolor TaxID=29722 RepID=UPI00258AB264|nr:uncharacterized protein LOC130828425 [Amaranthus tricolor]